MGSTIKIESNKLASKPGVDDYFKQMFGANTNDIQYIEINKLIPFEGQPFKPYSEEKLKELAEDISENGVLSPLLVRPYNDAYQILAGHNRANAAKLSELETVPCIIKDVDDDTARIIMVNTNLNQRDELLPSEKAFAYKMQLDTIKHQGQRADFVHNVHEGDSLTQIGSKNNDSRRNTAYYIRLTYLITSILDKVDNKQIPFRAGVSISYCNNENQQILLSFMDDHKIETITLDQADRIKSLEPFTVDALPAIFGLKTSKSDKSPAIKMLTLKIPMALLDPDMESLKMDDEFLQWISGEINRHMRENKEGA